MPSEVVQLQSIYLKHTENDRWLTIEGGYRIPRTSIVIQRIFLDRCGFVFYTRGGTIVLSEQPIKTKRIIVNELFTYFYQLPKLNSI
jgi:hypothetical protein